MLWFSWVLDGCHDFKIFSWLLVGFYVFFSRYFHGFSFLQFTIVNDAIFLLGHPDRCFWGSLTMYGIISDGWQPSVQQCDVCDVSFKSINISYGCRQLIITIPFEIHCYSGSTVHVQLWMWRSCVSFFLLSFLAASTQMPSGNCFFSVLSKLAPSYWRPMIIGCLARLSRWITTSRWWCTRGVRYGPF